MQNVFPHLYYIEYWIFCPCVRVCFSSRRKAGKESPLRGVAAGILFCKKVSKSYFVPREGTKVYFCVTKRRVQGGGATSERRRRNGVYQKSKRGRQLLSRRRRHTRCAYVSIPLFISFCRLTATRANILPRQSHRRLNRKRGSNPRLTRTFACSNQNYSCSVSMSIKPCSRSRSLAYSEKCS